MRAILNMDTVQIEITNHCVMRCGNCTRFCGSVPKPFYMTFDCFKQAVDSMDGFPKMTGIMGGEPLLHPEFEKFCEYIGSKIPRNQLGLWTAFPKGFEGYREAICRTFGNVFLNDHSRGDIHHAPMLVAAEEVILDSEDMWLLIENCWVQNSWSASINPYGAYFCEVAAAMAQLFNDPVWAWKVERGWWKKIVKDFKQQMERWCPKCGAAVPLPRRVSVDERDDVSPLNLERLKMCGSKKVRIGDYVVSDLRMVPQPEPMFQYKDMAYRQEIADRYNIFLTITDKGFWEPHLKSTQTKRGLGLSLFDEYRRECAN